MVRRYRSLESLLAHDVPLLANMKMSKLLFIYCAIPLAVSGYSYGQDLTEFSLYYEANTNGISGNAERHLVRSETGEYRLNISLEAKVGGIEIGDLEQASEFTWDGETIRPNNYSYQVSGVSSDIETVSFNWDAGIALSTEENDSWSIDLEDVVLDKLSYQLALARDVAAGKTERLEYSLVDGPAIEKHQFRILGTEVITTPMGNFNTVKLERVREADSGRSTIIWLASDWDYVLARIEQSNPGGLRIELQLTNALVAREQVTALPAE